jgi:phosphoribosylamine-glycine ligase
MENEDFNLVFEETFYKDWLLTQGANFHLYDMETRKRFIEQLSARSIVKTLIYDILEQGKQAKEFLASFKDGGE